MNPLKSSFLKNAPRILLGAFFLLSSCKDEAQKPAEKTSDSTPVEESDKSPATTSQATSTAKSDATGDIRFVAYNIKNYLTMEVFVKGGAKEKRPKRAEEIEALVKIIVSEKPDILGICEIGTPEDLKDLQDRLKAAGLDLPHTVHAGGIDSVRHLAILSALPIAENNSQHHLPYEIDGRERLMGRGILDVTINLPGGPTHFIGLHLKSKRPSEEFDEAELRLNEARLAKAHCDRILDGNPDARLVVYGDMNDTRKTPPMSALMGQRNSKNHLEDVFVKDSRDHLWTHYWSYQQQYARFDYVLVSRSIKGEVDWKNSYIADPDIWFDASDHRAIVVTFKGEE